jgi:hypothetical protein
LASKLDELLQTPWLLRVRRNHGLEHATIHVLTESDPRRSVAGHSDSGGFWLLGDLKTEDVEQAVDEALARLRAGERGLAVHPGCGTNLVTAGSMAGLAGAVAMRGANRRDEWAERVPLAILLSTLAVFAARPIGTRIQQRITTTGDPGNLRVLSIRPSRRGQLTAHRVETHSS